MLKDQFNGPVAQMTDAALMEFESKRIRKRTLIT